jgi:5-methyltetrahydropteroyltriglutamate--homocysteine methyltransferase
MPEGTEVKISTADAATRAETVGSLLRTPEVLQAVAAGDGAPGASAAVDDAVLAAIHMQERIGLDVITDGEIRRKRFVETADQLDCFEKSAAMAEVVWHGGDATTASVAPSGYDVVVRRVSEATRLLDATTQYAFLAEHAGTRTKYTLAAPSYHRRYWSPERSSEAYGSCEEYLEEIRDYQREIVQRLVELGCDYVQLDAPNYGTACDPAARKRIADAGRDFDAELAFDIALDNSLFDGISGVTRALHICRGNAAGGRWHSTGGYGAISAQAFPHLEFERLLLEYDTDRAGTFEPLADMQPGTVAVLGLLTTKSGYLEDEQNVRDRIAEAASIKPLAELALSTQCGFASVAAGNPVTPDQQAAKLDMVARLATETWSA